MWFFVLLFISYLIGSIPTSIIAGKLFRGIDIREHGSLNPGATNAFRVLGKKIGITVGAIDVFKGFFCVVFLPLFLPSDVWVTEDIRKIMAGISAVAGHMWTVFAGFKGGKGVGTAFGVFLGLAPLASLITSLVWCFVTFSTGYVSLGSIMSAIVLPVLIIAGGLLHGNLSLPISAFAVLTGILVIARHHTNIRRLIKGEENRFRWWRKQ